MQPTPPRELAAATCSGSFYRTPSPLQQGGMALPPPPHAAAALHADERSDWWVDDSLDADGSFERHAPSRGTMPAAAAVASRATNNLHGAARRTPPPRPTRHALPDSSTGRRFLDEDDEAAILRSSSGTFGSGRLSEVSAAGAAAGGGSGGGGGAAPRKDRSNDRSGSGVEGVRRYGADKRDRPTAPSSDAGSSSCHAAPPSGPQQRLSFDFAAHDDDAADAAAAGGSPALLQDMATLTLNAATVKKKLDFDERPPRVPVAGAGWPTTCADWRRAKQSRFGGAAETEVPAPFADRRRSGGFWGNAEPDELHGRPTIPCLQWGQQSAAAQSDGALAKPRPSVGNSSGRIPPACLLIAPSDGDSDDDAPRQAPAKQHRRGADASCADAAVAWRRYQ